MQRTALSPRLLLLQRAARAHMGSGAVAHGLSCSGTWTLPASGIEHVSPVLAGGFLITRLLGKSLLLFFFLIFLNIQLIYLFGCARFYFLHVESISLTRDQTQALCVGSIGPVGRSLHLSKTLFTPWGGGEDSPDKPHKVPAGAWTVSTPPPHQCRWGTNLPSASRCPRGEAGVSPCSREHRTEFWSIGFKLLKISLVLQEHRCAKVPQEVTQEGTFGNERPPPGACLEHTH